MVVGPLQGHGAQGRADRLCTPAGVAGRVSAPAGQAGGVLVTVVGVEPLGNETSRHRQDGGAHRRLGRLEVTQRLRRVGPQQPLDLTCRFGRQRLGDHHGLRFFFAALPVARRASLRASLTSMNIFDNCRKRRYSASRACVSDPAWAGMMRVTVLPACLRVSDRTGPCPGSPGLAQ